MTSGVAVAMSEDHDVLTDTKVFVKASQRMKSCLSDCKGRAETALVKCGRSGFDRHVASVKNKHIHVKALSQKQNMCTNSG